MIWLLFWFIVFYTIRKITIRMIKTPLQLPHGHQDSEVINNYILSGCVSGYNQNMKKNINCTSDQRGIGNQYQDENQNSSEYCFGDMFGNSCNEQEMLNIGTMCLTELCGKIGNEKLQHKIDQYLCLVDKLKF